MWSSDRESFGSGLQSDTVSGMHEFQKSQASRGMLSGRVCKAVTVPGEKRVGKQNVKYFSNRASVFCQVDRQYRCDGSVEQVLFDGLRGSQVVLKSRIAKDGEAA